MKPLKTLKGSRIGYSQFGVGKQVGSKIYIHINSRFGIIPGDVWDKAMQIFDKEWISPCWFNTLCYDLKKPHIIRFDFCEGFCTEREPVVGQMVFVDTETGEVWNRYNPQIYHHKWTFVPKDFKGFDVRESYEWSKLWLSKVAEVASGYQWKWEEQLKKYGLK